MKKNKKFHFEHDFFKLQKQTSAKLLYVTQVSHCDIDPLSLVMDTQYWEEEQVKDRPLGVTEKVQKHYPLPKGALILFVFLGNRGIPFTTYRQFTDAKLRLYRERVGETFDIYINGEPAKREEKEPDTQIKADI